MSDAFRPVKSAARTLDVLEQLAAGPRSFAQLTRELEIPKSSLHGILATLADRGWVETATDGGLRLGLSALHAGAAYLEADDAVARTASLLDRLAARTTETVQLARLDGDCVVYLAQRAASHPVRLISAVGSRLPAHATALGKALLATRDLEDVRARLTFPLAALTSCTIVEWDQLAADLEQTRERGYACDLEEAAEGLRCFAIPLPGARPATDAISVSLPSFRLTAEREQSIVSALRETSRVLASGRILARV